MTRKLWVITLVLIIALVGGVVPAAAQPDRQGGLQYVTYTVSWADAYGGLSRIAQLYCTTWVEIYNLNYTVIGPNPNVIIAGQRLTVPDRCSTPNPGTGVYDRGPSLRAQGSVSAGVYTVAVGDNLFRISQRFGISLNTLVAANSIYNPHYLVAYTRLTIPGLAA